MADNVTKGADEKFCESCGQAIKVAAEICPKCGVRQKPATPASVAGKKSKVTAGVLGILLGGLGVHKFYLGKWVQGIIYLLLCWTYVPSFIGFIEGIVYLSMKEQNFSAKYG